MTVRGVAEMSAAIQRNCKGKVPLYQIYDAIEGQNKELHGNYEWPWTKAEYIVPVQTSYNTGTIAVTDGTTAVTLTGGTWSTSWKYKRMYMGSNNTDRIVSAFPTTTTATLQDPVNIGVSPTAAAYTIYQDTYALPNDCDSVLLVLNPLFRYRLKYIPTYTLSWQNIFSRVFFSQFQTAFADAGIDEVTKNRLIQFAPAPSAVMEYKLIYRRRPPSLQGLAAYPDVPETFDRCIELLAEGQVRWERGLPGWMACRQQGYQLVKAMRRKMTSTQMYDAYSSYWTYPFYSENVSMYADGLFVGGPTSP